VVHRARSQERRFFDRFAAQPLMLVHLVIVRRIPPLMLTRSLAANAVWRSRRGRGVIEPVSMKESQPRGHLGDDPIRAGLPASFPGRSREPGDELEPHEGKRCLRVVHVARSNIEGEVLVEGEPPIEGGTGRRCAVWLGEHPWELRSAWLA